MKIQHVPNFERDVVEGEDKDDGDNGAASDNKGKGRAGVGGALAASDRKGTGRARASGKEATPEPDILAVQPPPTARVRQEPPSPSKLRGPPKHTNTHYVLQRTRVKGEKPSYIGEPGRPTGRLDVISSFTSRQGSTLRLRRTR